MKAVYQNIHQFKITLKNSKPPIWLRIQVPENYSFWDLHTAVQDAMDWMDCHLRESFFSYFRALLCVRIGLPGGNEKLAGKRPCPPLTRPQGNDIR
jgi:hypothetical protein